MRPTILTLTLAVSASILHAAFEPITLNPLSFNADVVVENTAIPRLANNTTATVDGGTNNTANTWYEFGYNTNAPNATGFGGSNSGLPAPGTTFTSITTWGGANHSYKMAPSYTGNNALLINTGVTAGTLTLTTPAIYSNLSFLVTSGNGGGSVTCIVHHQDGTSETNTFACGDWFGGSLNVAFIGYGRVNVRTGNFDTQGSITDPGNPRLYGRDIPVTNTSSPVTHVEIRYLSGGANVHNQIYAVSGAPASGGDWNPIDVTGYNADCIVEATAPRRGPTFAADGITPATTQSMDNDSNTANSWYEQGFYGFPIYAYTGLPPAGSTITNAAGFHVFTMPPSYTANNAIHLNPTVNTATITPAVPAAYSALTFLSSSGNGPGAITAVIHYLDGSSQTTPFSSLDWFNGATATRVFGASGRVEVHTGQLNNVPAPPTPAVVAAPFLFFNDIALENTTSPVTSIDLTYTSTGGRTAIFAVSGAAGAVPPVFDTQPQSVVVNVGADVNFTASASANAPISYQWQRGTNGVFVDLVDGGNISGATTESLTITGATEEDDADYRLVATTDGGSVNSSTAVLVVLSPLPPITQPSDSIIAYQPQGGSSPDGEAVRFAIDGSTSKYLNRGNGSNPMSVPLGFIVTPSMGRSIVGAMRLYTANDAAARDPANYFLEGSNDGGVTWTLISSNSIALPDGRNGGGQGLDPFNQNMRQVRFDNTEAYAQYRWFTTRVKGGTDLMQIGEVELLGVADTSGLPSITMQPSSVTAFEGSSASFFVSVIGDPTPSVAWHKDSQPLSDDDRISGSQTTFLNIDNLNFSDIGDYTAVATSPAGSQISTPARLTIVSTMTDITAPGDAITFFGDLGAGSPNAAAPDPDPALAIDDLNITTYINNGTHPNAGAGFPPFAGPCGLIMTPSAGASVVSGLRIYTGSGPAATDPADFQLHGSSNGGATWTLISSGSLSLPDERANNNLAFDPTQQPMQEVLFANSSAYTSYRITFNDVKNSENANSLQLGEIELLGAATPAGPTVTIVNNGDGTLTISTTAPGRLESKLNLDDPQWTDEGPVSGSVVITPAPGEPTKFYRIVVD